jgi:hypothetical protein
MLHKFVFYFCRHSSNFDRLKIAVKLVILKILRVGVFFGSIDLADDYNYFSDVAQENEGSVYRHSISFFSNRDKLTQTGDSKISLPYSKPRLFLTMAPHNTGDTINFTSPNNNQYQILSHKFCYLSYFCKILASIAVKADRSGARSSPARSLESWVRIPFKTWMSVCVCSVFVLGNGLATG